MWRKYCNRRGDAVGYADIAAHRPMRTDCMFWIASQSKPITAAALMILVDEGHVCVDDPVEKYFPEPAADHDLPRPACRLAGRRREDPACLPGCRCRSLRTLTWGRADVVAVQQITVS
ncbi:MAG: beta-lactamase family protein [Planctomycetaceae bacterium]|nr:beta-lactamase family protein [Planctomycetaceae bacterium]